MKQHPAFGAEGKMEMAGSWHLPLAFLSEWQVLLVGEQVLYPGGL